MAKDPWGLLKIKFWACPDENVMCQEFDTEAEAIAYCERYGPNMHPPGYYPITVQVPYHMWKAAKNNG